LISGKCGSTSNDPNPVDKVELLQTMTGREYDIGVSVGGIVEYVNNGSTSVPLSEQVNLGSIPKGQSKPFDIIVKGNNMLARTYNNVSLQGTQNRKSAQFAPNFPFEYAFLDDEFTSQYTDDRRISALYRLFTLLAIIISCLGLYSLVSSVLVYKTKEIGIRKVLGATAIKIISLVSKEFLLLITLSTLIGWPLSYLIIKKILNNYAYRAPVSPWIFIAAGLTTLILAAPDSWRQTRKNS